MSSRDSATLDPSLSSGQRVVHDTCVLARLVLGYLAHGETTETILREFPSISEEDVRAVIAFAAHAPRFAPEQHRGSPPQTGPSLPGGFA